MKPKTKKIIVDCSDILFAILIGFIIIIFGYKEDTALIITIFVYFMFRLQTKIWHLEKQIKSKC